MFYASNFRICVPFAPSGLSIFLQMNENAVIVCLSGMISHRRSWLPKCTRLKICFVSGAKLFSCLPLSFAGLKCKQAERTGVDSGPGDGEKSCQGSSAGVG